TENETWLESVSDAAPDCTVGSSAMSATEATRLSRRMEFIHLRGKRSSCRDYRRNRSARRKLRAASARASLTWHLTFPQGRAGATHSGLLRSGRDGLPGRGATGDIGIVGLRVRAEIIVIGRWLTVGCRLFGLGRRVDIDRRRPVFFLGDIDDFRDE